MEKHREEENRDGQPHNSAGGGRGKGEAPFGFEGMNFEQKRKPFQNASRSNKENGQSEPRENGGKRRDNL